MRSRCYVLLIFVGTVVDGDASALGVAAVVVIAVVIDILCGYCCSHTNAPIVALYRRLSVLCRFTCGSFTVQKSFTDLRYAVCFASTLLKIFVAFFGDVDF